MRGKDRNAYIVKKLESKVKLAIYNYHLIEAGDVVMVGVSGGKDSFSMLDLLVSLNRTIPEKFCIEVCHIQAEDMLYRADEAFIKNYCDKYNIPVFFKKIKVDYNPNGRQPACFICSWKRRKELFAFARERGCKKLALGHHLDDAVETLLMNMIHHSSISSIPPKLGMFDGELFLIRPLILIQDKDLINYSTYMQFLGEISLCQYEDRANRNQIRKLILNADMLNKSSRENIFRSMGNICEDYMVKHKVKKAPQK